MTADAQNQVVVSFEAVERSEWTAIEERRAFVRQHLDCTVPPAREGENRPAELFGVCLSGGGVRSASFCLGALQALNGYGLIPRIDYLSTVSGGGYIGGGLTAAFKRNEDGNPDRTLDFPFAVVSAGNDRDMRDSAAVAHIRDHGRYLMPGGPLDVFRSFAIILRGWTVNLVMVLSIVLVATSLFVAMNPTVDHFERSILYHIAEASKLAPKELLEWLDTPYLLAKISGSALLVYLAFWGVLASNRDMRYRTGPGTRTPEHLSAWTKWGSRLTWVFLALLVVDLQGKALNIWSQVLTGPVAELSKSVSNATVAIGGGTALLAFFRQTFVNWIGQAAKNPHIGNQIKAIGGKLALLALGLALPAVIYMVFLTVTVWGVGARPFGSAALPLTCEVYFPMTPGWLCASFGWWQVAALSGLAVAILIGVLASWPRDDKPFMRFLVEDVWHEIKLRRVWVLSALAVLAAVVGIAILIRPFDNSLPVFLVFLYSLAILSIVTLGFSPNGNALHRLYRDRLNEAFRLGKGLDGNLSLPLSELPLGPYHLINAALNVRRSRKAGKSRVGTELPLPDPAARGRNAEFFLLSKNYVGSDATKYVATTTMLDDDHQLDLATAIAVSGAAVSSSMGRFGVGILGASLALINLRLGLWMRNPRYFAPKYKNLMGRRTLVHPYLVLEAFGLLGTDSPQIYVTDGGHIDNIGLYQLLKRRCKIVIVVDAEADPAHDFGALVDVQRFARIDLGIRIDIDWHPIRKAAKDRAKDPEPTLAPSLPAHDRHFAYGRIRYDADPENDGVLLYVKASVTGDEGDYVLDYERRYPAFPHESTGDQFFSEEQMEAYRALGFHCMRRALDTKPDAPEGGAPGEPLAAPAPAARPSGGPKTSKAAAPAAPTQSPAGPPAAAAGAGAPSGQPRKAPVTAADFKARLGTTRAHLD